MIDASPYIARPNKRTLWNYYAYKEQTADAKAIIDAVCQLPLLLYIRYGMLHMRLDIHPDALDDLEGILGENRSDGAKIATFIDELANAPHLLDSMTIEQFGKDFSEPINVKKWANIHLIERINVWRLRSMSLEDKGLNYRFIYCYYFKDETHHIIAIVRKDEMEYDDPNSPLRKRVIATCRGDFPGS